VGMALKKFLKSLLIIIGVMIVVFGSLFYLMFYGLPWKKLETKRVAVTYLKNQYNQETHHHKETIWSSSRKEVFSPHYDRVQTGD
jgi:uncharacterized membrane protein (Fun14 family)